MKSAVRIRGGNYRNYRKMIAVEGDSKELFPVVKALLHEPKGTPLPSQTSDKEMAYMFGQIPSKKISKIRDGLTL